MRLILSALGSALGDLREPRVLAIVLLPALGALALWVTLSWTYWDDWSAWLNGLATGTAIGHWVEEAGGSWLIHSFVAIGLVALLVPALLVTATVITEIVAMPVIVGVVGGRHYPELEKKRGGTLAGGLGNTLSGIAAFGALWLLTLPLWLTGIGGFFVSPLLSAYLNQRLFRYDALAEHASADEFRRLLARSKGRLYLLGLVFAALYYVPLVNLLVPVLTGLAFTHLCLGDLACLRQECEVSGVRG